MAKAKKNSNTNDDIDLIKSDVASFASSLGLSSSLPSSGFNDTDFRKPAHLKPKKPQKKPKQSPSDESKKPEKIDNRNLRAKPKPKPSVLSLDVSNERNSGPERFKNLPKLPLMKPSSLGVWYSDAEELEAKLIGKEAVAGARDLEEWKGIVAEKKELGERLMAQFAKDYESSRGQSGDIKMLYASMRSGTEKDKVSAFSVLVGDNPVANLRAIDALLGLVATKVGKNRAVIGFDALKELFVSTLLPDRKLKTLFQQPLKQIPENKDGYSLLLLWHWEECLKQRYERFVVSLEQASKDVLPHLKDKAVKIIYVLLNSKAEQERRLLTALVNKLGDPKGASASNAAHHLTRLLSQSEHPNMRAVVINEVDSFLFRPHLELRAKYHAVNFLSQIFLSNKGDGPKVAKRLIDVYFALFKVVITETASREQKDKSGKQKDKSGKPSSMKASKSKPEITVDSHADWTTLLSAILTGVNRAFPYVSSTEADDIIESQTPVLFQLVHSDNFNVGIQALRLLHKITSKNQVASDRFYRALYGKLLLPASVQSSKVEMFIALLSAAMKTDANLKRLAAFAKRLLQVALQQQPQYACGYLFLLSEVLKSRPGLGQMVRQSELVDEEDEHFEDIIEENDEKKPKPAEKPVGPIENGRASTISGEEDSEDDDDISVSLSDDEASNAADDDDDFVVRGDSENAMESGKLSGPDHGNNKSLNSKRCELPGGYEPRHREPSYCNADRTGWWELTVLASHVHPSVSNWANKLLLGSDIIYSGDPVKDLSLPAFLDKFMEKKPKSSSWHGGSQIEPSKKLDMNYHLIGPEILSLADEDVPPEDLVFHKFYMNKQNSSKKPKKKNKKKKNKKSDEDTEDLFGDDGQDDESDNEEIENLLDSVDRSIEPDDAGEYDYDDLDKVTGEDDDADLVADDDDDADLPSDIGEDFDFGDDDQSLDGDDDEDDDNIIKIGDADDGEDVDEDEDVDEQPKRKRKADKAGASPFASLDEYEHLFKDGDDDDGFGSDDDDEKEEPEEKKKHKKSKSRKKKKKKSSE